MKINLKKEYLECGFGGGKTIKRKWKNVSESEWLELYKSGMTEPFEVVEEEVPKKKKTPLNETDDTKKEESNDNTEQGSN